MWCLDSDIAPILLRSAFLALENHRSTPQCILDGRKRRNDQPGVLRTPVPEAQVLAVPMDEQDAEQHEDHNGDHEQDDDEPKLWLIWGKLFDLHVE